jgi:cardiolipin synthase C
MRIPEPAAMPSPSTLLPKLLSKLLGVPALLLLAALAAGCAAPLPVVDRAAITSEAIEARPDTPLARIVKASTPEGEHSGFRLLPLGKYAFDTRLELARRAQVSLDVQYYHLEGDDTGRTLLRALRDAAVRGVRVRLLVDDFYLGGHDELFLAFAAHPNVEVRLFNPFARVRDGSQATRFLLSFDWKRVNHRMHNKMFIADGVAAVVGGRNIANEYFLRSDKDNFVDMDAFVVGKVVEPMAALFDRYWNSDPVYPLKSLATSPLAEADLRAHFERASAPEGEPVPMPPSDILGYSALREEFNDGRIGLHWGYAYAFADHPDKPFEGEAGGELLETSVSYNVLEPILKAEREVTISSPYFVPGPQGMDMLKQLRDRGVKVTILTNSLGATDEPIVHIGYTKYRTAMQQMGVEIYELSNSRIKKNTRVFHFGSGLGRLHAKLFVVDRKVSFIGSMNFDPRSATINTEFGMIVDSPPLARELLRVIDLDRVNSSYRLRLSDDGQRCEWIATNEDGTTSILTDEPDATWLVKLKLFLLRPLVPESLL